MVVKRNSREMEIVLTSPAAAAKRHCRDGGWLASVIPMDEWDEIVAAHEAAKEKSA